MSTTGQYGRRNSARDGPLLCADKEPIKGKGRSTRRERPHAKDRSTLLKGAAPATLARRERLSWRTYKPYRGPSERCGKVRATYAKPAVGGRAHLQIGLDEVKLAHSPIE